VVPLHERVDDWDPPRIIVVGPSKQLRPAGETVKERLTVPVNPFKGAMVTVEVPVTPAFTLRLVGLADIVKSLNLKMTVAEWESVVLVPVIVRV